MNEYQEQALKFLRTNGISLKIKKSEIQEPASWAGNGISGYKYDVTMTTERGAYRFPFWDSIANREAGKAPTKYDILACLSVWEGNIDDFTDEFGYNDQPTSETIKTYNAVIDQSVQLKHILNAEALRELEEIS